MGKLIEGQWHDVWFDTEGAKGEFVREQSQFRHWIREGGEFSPEPDRYHLYLSYACPWAHRALVFLTLKQLSEIVSVSFVMPEMLEKGWEFGPEGHEFADTLYGHHCLYELYVKANQHYTGRVTVPVLWDRKNHTIVNNESADIIRMFNSGFNDLTGDEQDFFPQQFQSEIERMNAYVYNNINNGVYKCGFATNQESYEEHCYALFDALDAIEKRLLHAQYLVANTLTEADWRLFTTLVRFDLVYFVHFKCNMRMLSDYPAISEYMSRLYHMPGIADTVKKDQIKRHYYYSHKQINPHQLIPLGPEVRF